MQNCRFRSAPTHTPHRHKRTTKETTGPLSLRPNQSLPRTPSSHGLLNPGVPRSSQLQLGSRWGSPGRLLTMARIGE